MNFITFLYLYILLTSNTTETNQETHDASLQVTFSPSVLHKLHFSSIIQFASLGSFYPDTINDIRCMALLQLFFLYFSLSHEKVMHTYGRTDRRTTLSVEVASGLKWINKGLSGALETWNSHDIHIHTYVFMKHVFVHIIFCKLKKKDLYAWISFIDLKINMHKINCYLSKIYVFIICLAYIDGSDPSTDYSVRPPQGLHLFAAFFCSPRITCKNVNI